MSIKEQIHQIQDYLWKGQSEKAVSLMDEVKIDLEYVISQFRALEDQRNRNANNVSIEKETPPSQTEVVPVADSKTVMPSNTNNIKTLSKDDRIARKQKILETAATMPSEMTFTSTDVIQKLEAEGYDLCVPESRKTTTVGGILSANESFERIDTGVFVKKRFSLKSIS